MPIEQLSSFIRIFNEFSKFRVLWKWEDEDISKLPKNVMVKPWLPQSDILAHPNVKLFITHGGLMGTQEGVYRGVPMLGIPIFCDQVRILGTPIIFFLYTNPNLRIASQHAKSQRCRIRYCPTVQEHYRYITALGTE